MKKIFASGSRRKTITLVAALTLILVLAIGGTIAWLTDSTTSVVNTFTPGEVTCEVVETVENNIKSAAAVKNTGNIPAYIRVAVVANTVDAQGNITGAYNVSNNLDTTDNWTLGNDGYYYYKGIVQPGAVTDGNLLKDSIDLTGIQVTILASAIQSTPVDAVYDAWGYDPSVN